MRSPPCVPPTWLPTDSTGCLPPALPCLARQVDVRSLKELMWRGIHSVPQPGAAPPSPDTVLEFKVSVALH